MRGFAVTPVRIYDVQCVIVIDVFLQPKASGCHTLGLTSDNFPLVSDGQNKLAYNVWYVSVNRAVADVTQGTLQPCRVCSTYANIILQTSFSYYRDTSQSRIGKEKKIAAVLFRC